MPDTLSVTLPAQLVAHLKTRVTFNSDADIGTFILDAARVYADLGALTQGGGRLMWHAEDGSAPRVVRISTANGGESPEREG